MTPEQKNRLLDALGYDLNSTPRDTKIVFTTSLLGRSLIEVDTGAGEADRHFVGDFTEAQNRVFRDLIEEARP